MCACGRTYKAFFVVGTVGDAAGDHVEVDSIIVGFDVDRGDHVVRSRGRVVFVGAKFLAHVLVVEAVQQACEALLFRQLLVLHEGIADDDIGCVLRRCNVAVLAFTHCVLVFLHGVCVCGGGSHTVWFDFIFIQKHLRVLDKQLWAASHVNAFSCA